MANSSRPNVSRPEEHIDDIEADFNPKLPRLGRRDSHLLPPGKLQVISQLHPFWRTKWGYAVIVLAVLAVIGGIVGGVIGGKRTGGGGGPATTTSANTSSTRAALATTAGTTTTTALAERAYPIRREAQPAPPHTSAVLTPQLVVQAEATTQPP